MSASIEPWPRVRSELIGDFRIFRMRRDWRRSPRTGSEHDFVVLESPDWVNVIALTQDDRAILVEQFRHGTTSVELEVPGGVMDAGDASPSATALRELREETGYVGERTTLLGSVATNPAILNNTCHTVLVEGCTFAGACHFDACEDIVTHLVPADDLPRLVARGRLRHALVAVAVYHFDLWRRGMKP